MTEPIPLRPDRRPARSQADPSEQAATGRPERAPTPPARESTLRRADVYSRPVVDGREVRENAWSRLRAFVAYSLQSAGERKEAEVGAQLAALPGPTRSNTVAVISPKGGVGKTTSTFVLGNALAAEEPVPWRATLPSAPPDTAPRRGPRRDEVRPAKPKCARFLVAQRLDELEDASALPGFESRVGVPAAPDERQ